MLIRQKGMFLNVCSGYWQDDVISVPLIRSYRFQFKTQCNEQCNHWDNSYQSPWWTLDSRLQTEGFVFISDEGQVRNFNIALNLPPKTERDTQPQLGLVSFHLFICLMNNSNTSHVFFHRHNNCLSCFVKNKLTAHSLYCSQHGFTTQRITYYTFDI